ncbi:magnesium/cobalt transporter CorA [Halarchaeum nitratireducens]|uniref:Magnesium transport protein CorA n=1 Tax=Halarchaeum nitratireducens TaxID=489913 RepID=A0A830GEA1_9EURY|nr:MULTISPECIES: magnesium/cobalt transporter CorA [Halarchaeum]MBP2250901.1 magnesium transporter [Halarchaeum solikamskense]GGN19762.1 magnesium transport protein CorA [Halarchaeum nitratireducens]
MTVEAVVYAAGGVTTYDDIDAAKAAAGTTWVRLFDPTPDELEHVASVYGLHPLTVEDVQKDIRPKVEEFDDHTFVLVKAARLASGDTSFRGELLTNPIGLFLGEDWLVTYATDDCAAVERTWRFVRTEDDRVLQRGPDFTAYRIVDAVVDDYFGALDDVEDRLEYVEDTVLDETEADVLTEINDARRELLALRKLLWPTRDAIGVLSRGDPPQVRAETEKYYRDVYDHLVQQVDLVETYRDLAAGARDIYLNTLSMSTNEVMKKLTVVATIVLPLTLVVGVFGMNFADTPWNMPELAWPYGYPAVMIGMGLVSLILLWYFRRESWL